MESCVFTNHYTSTCGLNQDESCCVSADVPGGTFTRNFSPGYVATVSTFALDRFEVTVARFRNWVGSGQQPTAGMGKHAHLNHGNGLVDAYTGVYETGWDVAWNANLPTDATQWSARLACETGASWTDSVGADERLPIDCVTWYEAYAFCIWDGGFLPSDAELNYAAAGGGGTDGQRLYPWSIPQDDNTLDCDHANYSPCFTGPIPVGSTKFGAGKWGQADLSGNVQEWTLDLSEADPTVCVDCANLTGTATARTLRGGGWKFQSNQMYSNEHEGLDPTSRYAHTGFRCARAP
jgi:formylglycine-generating enzyme required for sulfatase activity